MAEVRNEAINEVRKEYIEREAVIEKLMNLDPPGFEQSIAGKVAIQVILASPAADVVEVVRCEKCKHYETSDWDGEILCGCNHPFGLKNIEPNTHCSYGERKE